MINPIRIAALSLLLAGSAQASGDALFLRGTGESRSVRSDYATAANRLGQQAFDVVVRSATDARGVRGALTGFINNLDGNTDMAVVLLSGRFVHTATGSYYLPSDVPGIDLARVLTQALPLDAVLSVLAGYPGRSVLLLADRNASARRSQGLVAGLGLVDVPQGVTVLTGTPETVAPYLSRDVSRRGTPLVRTARSRKLTISGYAPEDFALLLDEPASDPEPIFQVPQVPDTSQADESLWARVSQRDDPEAYRDYLGSFPDGAHAAAARQRIGAIEAEPFYRERKTEESLKLSRNIRREVQRNLTLLGFNTRGVDGIFGRGSRAAIKSWQANSALPQSGYLNSEQITRLSAQAERRAIQLQAEERRKQEELARLDRAYWQETGARDDVAGLSAYLNRYPKGEFAETARQRLSAYQASQRQQAAEQDLGAWREAEAVNTRAAYQSYLQRFPDGSFAGQATARIESLGQNNQDRRALEQAKARERSLGLSRGAKQLAEQKLRALNLRPGKVDGVFDEQTRRAIRRYQTSSGLGGTGYLDQDTVVRLLADSLLRSR